MLGAKVVVLGFPSTKLRKGTRKSTAPFQFGGRFLGGNLRPATTFEGGFSPPRQLDCEPWVYGVVDWLIWESIDDKRKWGR